MQANKIAGFLAKGLALSVLLGVVWPATAQETKTPYPNMAPLEQYLMEDRSAEVALARSAAPDSISRDAEVLVLARHGYETAAPGKNGFVCLVQRSWTAPSDDPNFWNPKLRAPICLNPVSVRSFLPNIIKKTDLILAGRTKSQMFEAIVAAIDKKELPPQEPGAIGYMMSKQAYLSDKGEHWLPHLMFFAPQVDPAVWGAGLEGSPIIAFTTAVEHMTVFLVPVRRWSDGTPAATPER